MYALICLNKIIFLILIQKACSLLAADISGHIKSGPGHGIADRQQMLCLETSLSMDFYCKGNEFHWIPVAADNTWQVPEKQKREQILYKCAAVYYVVLHMTNATIKAEYQ